MTSFEIYIQEFNRIKEIIEKIEKNTKREPQRFIEYVYKIEKEMTNFRWLYEHRESCGDLLFKDVYDKEYIELTAKADEALKNLRMGKTMERMKKRFTKGFKASRIGWQVISHYDFFPIIFGKYKGKNLDYIMQENPSYINWALCNVEYFGVSTALYSHYIEQGLPNIPMAYRNAAVKTVIAIELTEEEEEKEYDWREEEHGITLEEVWEQAGDADMMSDSTFFM